MQTMLSPNEQIQAVLLTLQRILGDALLGVYLHGSAVSGGLKPQSDIDLLAVVTFGLTGHQRYELLTDLLQLSGRHPTAAGDLRCLEVAVFRKSDLTEADYPARADFVYGEWMRDIFEAGAVPMPERDPEFTLLIAQARREAIALLGPPPEDSLPDIYPVRIHEALRDTLPAVMSGLCGDERNALLTLARIWHTASEGRFLTKDAAASWAIPQLAEEHAAVLNRARLAYLGETADDSDRGDAARQLAEHLCDHIARAL